MRWTPPEIARKSSTAFTHPTAISLQIEPSRPVNWLLLFGSHFPTSTTRREQLPPTLATTSDGTTQRSSLRTKPSAAVGGIRFRHEDDAFAAAHFHSHWDFVREAVFKILVQDNKCFQYRSCRPHGPIQVPKKQLTLFEAILRRQCHVMCSKSGDLLDADPTARRRIEIGRAHV